MFLISAIFMKKIFIRTSMVIVLLLIMSCIFIWFANHRIVRASNNLTYNNIENIPYNHSGLLLGTSKHLKSGSPNPFFDTRIEAAATLYKTGKIKYIVASGDNSKKHYNEPQQMKDDLIALGVPDSVIYLDYAGFRTLDSIVRGREIFGQNSVTVISQKFHNERAVYIGRTYGISVIGFNAVDTEYTTNQFVRLREVLARLRAFIDVKIIKIQPKFLGEEIIIL